MAIPESQLETWSHQGSITQSSATYATIRSALEASSAAYSNRDFTIFLQGSYSNDTNIWADSDVDVVIQLNSIFYYGLKEVPEPAQSALKKSMTPASYSYAGFKQGVIARLESAFPSQVRVGKKAICISGAGNRRDADVLAAANYRRYYVPSGRLTPTHVEGLCFFTTDGVQVVNYPKLHSDRCTAKHQATAQWFKPVVRIFKNMRNRAMNESGLGVGVAPSYFLEGLLYNVPNNLFGGTCGESVANALQWVQSCDRSKLTTASGQHWLVRDSRSVCWRTDDFAAFMRAMTNQWDHWRAIRFI